MKHYLNKTILRRESGFTLIEVVLTITVLSVGVAGILSVMLQATRSSGDPMQRQQALNIAQAYMEEIISRPFYDPQLQPIAPPAAPCTQQEADRTDFDDICDYQNLTDANPIDLNGNPILDENGVALPYEVRVDVATADLGPDLSTATPPSDQLAAASNQAMLITVTVTPPGSPAVVISSYRTAQF